MYKKFLFLLVAIVLLPLKHVGADAAPEPPQCAGGFSVLGGNGTYVPSPVTCGFLSVSYYLSLGQYKDKFVLLEGSMNRYVDAILYSVAEGDTLFPGGKYSADFLAVEKNYFDANGGISGIFSKRTLTDETFGNNETMEPKNSDELRDHSYKFLVLKDDPLNATEGGVRQEAPVIQGKYRPLPSSVYTYAATPRLECNSDNFCGEKITYAPQAIVEDSSSTYFVLQPAKTVYSTSSDEQWTASPTYNQPATTTVQTQLPIQPQTRSSWWQRFWSWIAHLF